MKRTYFILVLIAILCSCNTAKDMSGQFNDNIVIAHRGAWKNTGHPQNSIASLNAAIALGCRGSELDIQLTADDSLIVYHDLKHHDMVIDSTSYAELIKIPLKNGEKIPTLREYLSEGVKQSKTKLIVDVKTPKNKARTVQSAQKALEMIKELNVEKWVEFLAGDLNTVSFLIENTTLPIAYLGQWKHAVSEMNPEYIFSHGIKYIDYQDVHYKENDQWIELFKKKGIHLNAWTVNSEPDMKWFLSHGFDYITTDEPELLLSIVNNNK